MEALPSLLTNRPDGRSAEKAATNQLTVSRQVRRMKVACISTPEAGHLVPMVQIAKALARRGHQSALITMDCAREKFAKGCEAVGCEFVGLGKGIQGSDAGSGLASELTSKGLFGILFRHYDQVMREEFREWLQTERPDVVVADMVTLGAVKPAKDCGIPLILNVPGPFELFKNMSISLILTLCAVSFLQTRSLTDTRIMLQVMRDILPAFSNHLCLVNSFFGLDTACPLPPNIIMTGSTAPRPSSLVLRETSDERFNAWLQRIRGMGLRIVYVTMGSMQVLEPFQVRAIFEGLLALSPRCAVAWSLKPEQQAFLPGGVEKLPAQFFVQKWLPQGEALQLPDVAAVVTHCGFGGLNETIAAGKPLVALPFRADQPANAKIARARGLAEVLSPPKLTASAVSSAVGKVLNDQTYGARAVEVQRSMLKTGGAEACVDAIEHFVEHGGCNELFEAFLAPELSQRAFAADVDSRRSCGSVCLVSSQSVGCQAQAIQELVLSEVDYKVREKTDEMFTKGKQVVAQMKQRHQQTVQQHQDDIARLQKSSQDLEAENARLKQLVQSLATNLASVNTGYLNGKDFSSPDSCASTTAEDPEATTKQLEASTPPPFAPQARVDADMPLPEVPGFPPLPLSPVPGTPGAPISLAESLGQVTPQRTPLSLMQSLTPTMEMPSPFTVNGRALGGMGEDRIFSFTLRKADGTELGLNVSHHNSEGVLLVEGIRPGGAVEAWNRQCLGSAFAEKAVFPKDRIISVNHIVYNPAAMLQECKEKQLLKLTIARGNVSLPSAPGQAGSASLRADASEFVPGVTSKPTTNGAEEKKEPKEPKDDTPKEDGEAD
ncbi:Ugt3a1 [Symbiodinium natans]|uniref:Ugt3a1 protein n=1 Tax=Symbiodinium natans TaxID=878477 RepID=A0A812SV50_9DINO|nr:Ugt3a1 [Symbiodinium natans]